MLAPRVYRSLRRYLRPLPDYDPRTHPRIVFSPRWRFCRFSSRAIQFFLSFLPILFTLNWILMELNEIERPFKEKGEKEKCTFDQKRKEKELNYREWDINTRFHRVKKRSGKNKDPFVIPSSIPRCINNLSSPNFFSSNSINRRVFFPGIFRAQRTDNLCWVYIYI